MAKVVRNCDITIKNTNSGNILNKTIKDVKDSTEAYNKIRSQICKNNNISIREFENIYDVENKKTFVKFADKPWSDGNELEKDINNISSVQNAFYIPPTRGSYGPPAYRIKTDVDLKTLQKDVKNYYDGLLVEQKNNSKLIIISPTRYIN
jgi:hypothetical protein